MKESNLNKIKQTKTLRQIPINSLRDIKVFADKAANGTLSAIEEGQFCALFVTLSELENDFKAKHSQLMTQLAVSTEEGYENEDEARQQFALDISYVRAVYNHMFPPTPPPLPSATSVALPPNIRSNIRLPKIDLPKFNGELTQFKSFIDLFDSLIHCNEALSDVEKFHYLTASLQGPPLSMLKNLPSTSQNYAVVYKNLLARYDNVRLTACAHLKALHNAPVLTKSSSTIEIRNLLDTFQENVAALTQLGLPVSGWSFLLYFQLSQHVDDALLGKFESTLSADVSRQPNAPWFNLLTDFLQRHCSVAENVEFLGKGVTAKTKDGLVRESQPRRHAFLGQTSSASSVCAFCKGSHNTFSCQALGAKSPSERREWARTVNRCFNCLGMHRLQSCQSTRNCRHCGKRHHSLLHPLRGEVGTASSSVSAGTRNTTGLVALTNANNISSPPGEVAAISVCSSDLKGPSEEDRDHVVSNIPFCGVARPFTRAPTVLLSTAMVDVLDRHGQSHVLRALLDSGSEMNYITVAAQKRLGLRKSPSDIQIHGLGTMKSVANQGMVQFCLRPRELVNPQFQVEALVLSEVCPPVPRVEVTANWPHISDLNLADPMAWKSKPIDLLLGAEMFAQILLPGKRVGANDQPHAIETSLGWILMGKVSSSASVSGLQPSSSLSLLARTSWDETITLSEILKRFWEIESLPATAVSIRTAEEELCEQIYCESHARDETGRYIVYLPFKDRVEPDFNLHESVLLARKRFCSLEKRLLATPSLHVRYSQVMKEHLDNDFMEEVPRVDEATKSGYYIPHHCVVKPEKLRVVYNASARLSDGVSLNDTLLIGEKLQSDIRKILIRFRFTPIAFICDIKAMFTQIVVNKSHRDYQRLLWRFDPKESIKHYRFKRVTFGLASSPFLANRTIQQLILDEGVSFPRAADVLRNDIYVDDIVTGCQTLAEALSLRQELSGLLLKGGFELRKWCSNEYKLLSDLPAAHRQLNEKDLDLEEQVTKILGLRWHPNSDTFTFKVSSQGRKCTKRGILSEIARLYDPLGLVAPVVIYAKQLLQYVWTLGLDWDDPVPDELRQRWENFQTELSDLEKLAIPRHVAFAEADDIQLHGFCDASEKAYASVIYVRITQESQVRTHLVLCRSRVAPLKRITLPRLELLAAVLLVDSLEYVIGIVGSKFHVNQLFAWTDSTIVLAWVKSPPHKWKTFVANRVSRILEVTPPESWHHIVSEENPADMPSRGLRPSELTSSSSWWYGPDWLIRPEREWHISTPLSSVSSAELKPRAEDRSCFAFPSHVQSPDVLGGLLEGFSSLSKVLRILAYIYRFGSLAKVTGPFSIPELRRMTKILVRYTQFRYFPELRDKLVHARQVPKPFLKLNIWLDSDGIIKVGGRLQHASISFHQKHPMLLPQGAPLTTLLISHLHKIFLHPGPRLLHFILLQSAFWVVSARRAINRVVGGCVTCFKMQPRPFQPIMAELPAGKVNFCKAFEEVGLDYAGPFLVLPRYRRQAKPFKVYVGLFVCLAVKALHLELINDLTAEACLGALKRFLARRGRCSVIHSDCGTNFVAAQRYLQTLFANAANAEVISWRLNPPNAPNFNGLAEISIKSVKTQITKVIGDHHLTWDEFSTLLTQIESLLNSRPLCEVDSEVETIAALTPAHFLNLRPVSWLPEAPEQFRSPLHNPISLHRRWQLVRALQNEFCSRWKREYLLTLQARKKWMAADTCIGLYSRHHYSCS